MSRVTTSQFPDHHTFHNNHDQQQPKQTYSPVTSGGIRSGRGRGNVFAVNCWECGEPGHISRNCPVRNYAQWGNRASSSDPSEADAIESKQTYSSVTSGGGWNTGGWDGGGWDDFVVNCWECGEPGHISRNCPHRNHALRENRDFSSDPSKADAIESTSGTPKVRAKPMNTSTEVSVNAEPVKVCLPQKNVNISPLQATIEQKEKELQLCGQKIDTLNSQLNKATTDLKCARAKNEDMAVNVNSLQKELEKCRKELSSLKDQNETWAKKYGSLNEDMALNVKSLEQQLEKCRKESSSFKELNEKWAKTYRRMNEDKVSNVKRLVQQLERYKKELSSLKEKDEAWAHKYCCLNEDMTLNVNSLEQQLEKCTKELSSLKDKDEVWVKEWSVLNKEFAETKHELNEKIKHLEEANETVDDEISMQKLETEKWRKTAKAIASVLVGNAELCSKTPELESLVLYYTNRAAKRMYLKKFGKAMDDCRMATYLDPGCLKVRLIAGNCHLILGEIYEALCCYQKCLDSAMVCFDRRLTIEASDGLQNAEKVVNLISQSTELLQLKSFESATRALEIITEALSISCYSEKLLELKGEALFRLQKYEEVVELCEETLAIAEKNCTTTSNSDCLSDEDRNQLLNCWRLCLMSRSYFCMAKFDMALATLDRYEQLEPLETMTKGPSSFSAATVRELLRIKSAGNDAYQTGKYREAVEHYSNAIMRSIESRPFTAICLCNRAAAHQALGRVIDAIADCNLAIALDGDYMKAISRRANLHEKIRDYEEAALDFQRLVCLLEKRSEKKYLEELTIARRRLSSANSNVKKGMTMDLYLILGLKGSESGSEIKKAYHKAALKHHPDKAGKFLTRSESGAEGDVLKEIFATIHEDADKLFKKIGEAYAVLSDATKRSKY